MRYLFLFFASLTIIMGCQSSLSPDVLPMLGTPETGPNGDSIPHTIPDFSFIDQDSNVVNNETFAGKAYVADFFFIACPTICPKTSKQMLRIHDRFKEEPRLELLGHTLAPKYDSVAALNRYAHNLGVSSDKWHFVTGDQAAIYKMAPEYMNIALNDEDAPGGINHSGYLILVDKNRHIRSFCNGTDPDDVDRFMDDIQKLLNEK
ncbi:MAG: SCO family protein [Bacteroidetes bacterium]|nr:SCO family protein [Bacteroidota bacterium]